MTIPDPSVVHAAQEHVHETCLRMVSDGLVIGSAGNISVRVGEHHIVVTARGVVYSRLTPQDHPVVDLRDGSWVGPKAPTSEIALHLGVMREMTDVSAVVHTHSRYAAGFAVARIDLPFICNESLATRAERVLVTEYAPPGTADLGDQAMATFRKLPGSRAVLLANHGVVAIGGDLDRTYVVAQSVEWTAQICAIARQLGGEVVLEPDVQDSIGRNYGISIAHGPEA
jgi:L-fuculose-phosphate aldolase